MIKDFEQIKKHLKGAELAYVFGSYAGNSQDEYSDLDILIVKKTSKDFFYRFQDFQGIYDLGVPVDLLIYTPEEFAMMRKSQNRFIENIIRHGIRII